MRILVIGRSIPEEKTGLIGLFEYGQAKALREQENHEIIYGFLDNRSIKVLRKVGVYKKNIDYLPVYGIFFPVGGLYKKIYDKVKFILFKRLLKEIENDYGTIDIIHVHYPTMLLNKEILIFLQVAGIKLICTEHWTKVQNNKLTVREMAILKDAYEVSNKFITVSQDLRDSILSYFPDYDDKLIVIPNIIDSEFTIQEPNNHFFSFVTIGRLAKVKRNIEVLEAFSKLHKINVNTMLYIVGEGEEKENLVEYVKSENLEKYVIFTGFINSKQISTLFNKVNVYISASELETFGVPVVEAWFSGRPTIIRNTHPLRNYINEENGMMFSEHSELSLKMLECMKKEYDTKKINKKAKKFFSKESIVKELNNIYLE